MQLIPELAVYALTLVFGEVLSAAFAGVKPSRKNNILQIAAIVFPELLLLGVWILFGPDTVKVSYPLLIHLPLICTLIFVFHEPFFKAVICVLVTCLCCQIPQLTGTVVLLLIGNSFLYYAVYYIVTLVTLFFLLRYHAKSTINLPDYPKTALLFCFALSAVFYIAGYLTTIYAHLFHSDMNYMVQLLVSCASIFYFLILIIYDRELSYRQKTDLENRLLAIQTQQALKNLENYQKIMQQTAVSLHDQRHHLALLYNFLQEGRTERALDYISKVLKIQDAIPSTQSFCRNNTVNLILTYFAENAASRSVDFQVEAALPPKLSVSETDLCVLLSNILENAIKAAAQAVDVEAKRFVRIRCHLTKGYLVLLAENSYTKEVILKDGMPFCTEYGHGFGTKSIAGLAKKHHGYCSFRAENGIFIVKIVLPCKETE